MFIMGIGKGSIVETRKAPTRRGKVIKATDHHKWKVLFSDEDGESYYEDLKSNQLKDVSTQQSKAAALLQTLNPRQRHGKRENPKTKAGKASDSEEEEEASDEEGAGLFNDGSIASSHKGDD